METGSDSNEGLVIPLLYITRFIYRHVHFETHLFNTIYNHSKTQTIKGTYSDSILGFIC